MKKLFILILMATVCFAPMSMQAQVTIGSNEAPNDNALLDLKNVAGGNGSTKGLLLPRVALTGTNQATPLTAHVAGMTVYNTATEGTAPNNVTPGYYYNDGTKWVRLLTSITPNEPWYVSGTTTQATQNTENVYMMGNVAVGTNESNANKLFIKEKNTGSNISTVRIESLISGSNYRSINFYNKLSSGKFSNIVQASDFGIVFSQDNDPTKFSPTYGFVITPDLKGEGTTTYTGGIKIFDNGAVSIGNNSASEMFTVNGTARFMDLPTHNTPNSVYHGIFDQDNPTK